MHEDLLNIGTLKQELPSYDALRSLVAFAKAEDMVKAARSLSVSQPALSFQLKKLEEQLGFQLFTFSGKRKVLTQVGKAYVSEMEKLLIEFRISNERFARDAVHLESQSLKIAGRRELLIPMLQFPFPGQIEFVHLPSNEALQSLIRHEVDLAISTHIEEYSDLIAHVFFESGFQLILPPGWKASEIGERPVVAYGRDSTYLKEYAQACGILPTSLRVSRVVEDWYSVVELVKGGFGWSVIPQSWNVLNREVTTSLIRHPRMHSQKVYFFFRREDRKSVWVKNLEDWAISRQNFKQG